MVMSIFVVEPLRHQSSATEISCKSL